MKGITQRIHIDVELGRTRQDTKTMVDQGGRTKMRTRQLGKYGPQVPVICLGAWPLGGGMGVLGAAMGGGIGFALV